MKRCTYADTFNRFYSLATRNRSVARWIRTRVQRRRSRLSDRLRFARHMRTIRQTQTIGSRIDPETLTFLERVEHALTLGWIIHHLRPLQRRVIKHLWRPDGPMERRRREELFISMRGAALPVGCDGAPREGPRDVDDERVASRAPAMALHSTHSQVWRAPGASRLQPT